jgi:hypothetical protein
MISGVKLLSSQDNRIDKDKQKIRIELIKVIILHVDRTIAGKNALDGLSVAVLLLF